jgi:hypothetical protein
MNQENCISLEAEVNIDLHETLLRYLDNHPYWDVNRVINASLSLFMMQNWSKEQGLKTKDYETCSQVYLDSVFQEYRTHLRYEQDN